jgi:hypothetical protein
MTGELNFHYHSTGTCIIKWTSEQGRKPQLCLPFHEQLLYLPKRIQVQTWSDNFQQNAHYLNHVKKHTGDIEVEELIAQVFKFKY